MKTAELLKVLPIALQNNFNVLLKGRPGIGKSDIIIQTVNAINFDLQIVHPVVEEPTDAKGLPCVVNGVADFMPYGNLRAMIEAKRPLVVFIDDLGQAPQSVQAAYMQLLLAREINGKKISPHVRFIAATNSRKDNAGVNGLLTPLLSRFRLIAELEVDITEWQKWAIAKQLPTELIAFSGFRPEFWQGKILERQNGVEAWKEMPVTREIENFACPRTIAALGEWIKAGITSYDVWTGCTGSAFATEFAAFYQTYTQLAGLPAKVIADPANAPIPSEPSTLFALCAALARKATPITFSPIMQYAKRLAKEFQVMTWKTCIAANPKLTETKEFIDWQTLNPDVVV